MNGTINVRKLNDMGETAHLAVYFSILSFLLESKWAYEMAMLSVFSSPNS
jgi:hypothetical protein